MLTATFTKANGIMTRHMGLEPMCIKTEDSFTRVTFRTTKNTEKASKLGPMVPSTKETLKTIRGKVGEASFGQMVALTKAIGRMD